MIKRLVIKDCLGIEELALTPGKLNVISGGNEKGKTSILETIEKALFNTKRRAKFVRIGADRAYIELETDDGINIRRNVEEDDAGLDSGSVKVTKDGVPVKAPETYLKELFGSDGKRGHDVFAFSPVDFMMKKDTEQTDILLGLLPIFVTPEEAAVWFKGVPPKVNYQKHGLQVLKDLEQWFYDARREANARVKATEDEAVAVAKRIPDNYDLEKWMGVELGRLFKELQDAQTANLEILENRETLEAYPDALKAIDNQYALQEKEAKEYRDFKLSKAKEETEKLKASLRTKIEEATQQIHAWEKKRAEMQVTLEDMDQMSLPKEIQGLDREVAAKVAAIKEARGKDVDRLDAKKLQARCHLETHQPIDIAPIKNRCAEAEAMKAFIPLAKEVEFIHSRLKTQEAEAAHYDWCVEAARKKPHELLSQVELPIKDLGVDGKGMVTIKGLPLSNLSTAQQVRTCLEIAKALAKDSPLKLICVDKLEHLDETVRKEFLAQIEAAQDWQFFVTVVTDGELKVETK